MIKLLRTNCLSFQVVVSYHDKERIPTEKLERSNLRIQTTVQLESGGGTGIPDIIVPRKNGRTAVRHEFWEEDDVEQYLYEHVNQQVTYNRYRQEGVFYFKFDVPKRAVSLAITAHYEDEDGDTAQAHLSAVSHYSPNRKYISVRSSTTEAEVGEYVIFHVKTNYRLNVFQYLVSTYAITELKYTYNCLKCLIYL